MLLLMWAIDSHNSDTSRNTRTQTWNLILDDAGGLCVSFTLCRASFYAVSSDWYMVLNSLDYYISCYGYYVLMNENNRSPFLIINIPIPVPTRHSSILYCDVNNLLITLKSHRVEIKIIYQLTRYCAPKSPGPRGAWLRLHQLRTLQCMV